MEDRRGKLKDERPYSCRFIDSERARIFFKGKPVFMAVGKDYRKLLTAVEGGDEYAAQLVMARITGNFKHGNER